jgi:hypothetical protein
MGSHVTTIVTCCVKAFPVPWACSAEPRKKSNTADMRKCHFPTIIAHQLRLPVSDESGVFFYGG